MKFCKKCHRLIVKVIYTKKNLGIRCRCDDTALFAQKSEVFGIINETLTREKRCGIKRKIVKGINSG